MTRALGVSAMLGGAVYAAAGAVMAARNLRWFGWAPNANPLMVWLGVGFGLVVLGFAVVRGGDLWRRGVWGHAACVSGVMASAMLVISGAIEFAIFGTLLTFVCLLAFSIVVHREELLGRREIVVLYIATVASITWNTETPSAALLVIVGAAMAWVSFQALVAGRWGVAGGVGR